MWPALIGGGAALVGGLLGANEARAGRESAEAAQRRAIELLQGVEAPTVEEQKAILEELRLIGKYNPEALQSIGLEPSALENVSPDQETVEAQKDALSQIMEVAKGGYTEGDKALMRDIERQVSQNARARQQSILNEMAQRGTLGSGMELAARMKGEQQAIDQQAAASDRAIREAQARALQALTQQNAMAGQQRSQAYQEQANLARARDEINRFNASNRQNIINRNIAERNRAQAANLAAQQEIANANVNLRNQNELRNKALLQQQFENEYRRAGGQATAVSNLGQIQQAGRNATGRMYAGIGSAIGDLVTAFGSGSSSSTPTPSGGGDEAIRPGQVSRIKGWY